MDATLALAFEATWPAAEYADAGGFRLGHTPGAGGRVNSARATGPWSQGDIDAAIDLFRGWNQPAVFRVMDDNTDLRAALEARGFAPSTPTAIMTCAADRLTDQPIPTITTFAVWPPLAIQRDIWAAGSINPARQAVMDAVPAPRASVLGRIKDRAAGAAFVAIHGDVAMVHAVEILPDWRRLGLAGWMMRQAAFWAVDQGAARIGLAVSRQNDAAMALYQHLGFSEVAGYGYYQQ
ncbi:GNAT family N-acetyltransferase [Paracoccus tegillarcae]|uniref:GNAT family N-acetyltransferase n=1 Tax=Paracoccus tegillarcae TaxID=1529068 RepID=A0A2K9F3T9_9RHOB|nr:GNAT family N-acetyltransferase [Paracoccus tegillarcae]AUH33791.1 GNAT family N-acetyltransferase [Paracoccus tegillarcae]